MAEVISLLWPMVALMPWMALTASLVAFHRLGGLVQLQRRCRHRLDEVRHFALEAFGMFAELGRRHTLGGMGADCGEYLNIE